MATYYMRAVLGMHLEDFGGYAPSGEMVRHTATSGDVVLTKFGPPCDPMAYRVDGSESTSTAMYGLGGVGRWDDTTTLLDIADDFNGTSHVSVSTAGYPLMAVSDRAR